MSSGFRVTQRSLTDGALANLQGNASRLQRLQEQLSSGRAISRPSDSPTGTVAALRLRADGRRADQLLRNGADGLGWLGTADTSLIEGLSLVRRARELALRGVNASMSDADRAALATEVDGLREGLLALANASYLGRPVFAGTADVAGAYDAAGAYQGDAGAVTRSVAPGVSVPVNLTGEAVFGASGGNLFATLSDLATHLRSEPGVLTADVGRLDEGFLRMQNALATVGSRYHQIEVMSSRVESSRLDGQNQLSEVEGVDLPATIVELQLAEVAYQAALGATARVITPTLADFLR